MHGKGLTSVVDASPLCLGYCMYIFLLLWM